MEASRSSRSITVVACLAIVLGSGIADGALAQDAGRQAAARELAAVMIDESMRRTMEDQVSVSLVRVIGGMVQERLNRRLQEGEARALIDIVKGFVAETLTRERIEEIGARAYASHFDEAELRELYRFHTSPLGKKAGRLTPVIGSETARAIEEEIQQSPAVPRLMEALQRVFPVLRSSESP